ncbi:MAG: MBL fold metallo-hydrolase [Bacteroidota bacterium]|nr:MBL fold metallo-hydrolase [Bacteroidota bacterium]
MHRRNFLRNAGVLTGASILLQQKALAAFFRTAEFNIKMLRNNVGIFTERGGTIGFILGKDGIAVIDSQFPDTSAHLIEELKKKPNPTIRLLLNTHHHGDHSSGNIAFKGLAEHVVAHQNSLINQKAVAEKQSTVDKQLFPDKTFDKDVKLKVGNEKITGYYFGAGHTNGDAIYHFEDTNIMHLGDLLFNKRHPFVDRSAGANMRSWITVLDKVQKQGNKNTLYIFGHSLNSGEETGTTEDIKKFQDYLGKVLQFAEAEIKRGVTKDEFIKNTAIPGVTEWSGSGIERPLTAAYEEISTTDNKKA